MNEEQSEATKWLLNHVKYNAPLSLKMGKVLQSDDGIETVDVLRAFFAGESDWKWEKYGVTLAGHVDLLEKYLKDGQYRMPDMYTRKTHA